jgi:hypothetical protein
MSNNNLRDQFPGIAKTDKALNFAWNIAGGIFIGLILAVGYTGVVKLYSIVTNDDDLYDQRMQWGNLMAIVALALCIVLPLAGFALDLLVFDKEVACVPTINFVVWWIEYVIWYGWLLGLCCHVVSWIVDKK